MTGGVAAIHPGAGSMDFMLAFGLCVNAVACCIGAPLDRLSVRVADRCGVTNETALRLRRTFGLTPEFWLRLQAKKDLETARYSAGAVAIGRLCD